MSCGVVEIFPILDADEIRELDRIVQTAIPTRYAATTQESRSQLPLLGLSHGLDALVDIVLPPRYARRLVYLRPGRLGAGEKWRIADSHDPVCQIDLSA